MKFKKQELQIDALASIADYVTHKDTLQTEQLKDLESRLDDVLASMDQEKKFFKRLL